MLYVFLLVKPFNKSGTKIAGILFAVWLLLGFVCSVFNIVITASTTCVSITQWGKISTVGCLFIMLVSVGNVIAATVMLLKWAKKADNKINPSTSKSQPDT